MALRLRRGTDAERQLIIPESGELIFTTDTNLVYVGDGITTGGLPVSTAGITTEVSQDSSPELGGDLDIGAFTILGDGSIDIVGDIDTEGDITANNIDVQTINVNSLAASTSPELTLESNLDLNTYDIVGVGNINIDGVITATGNISLGDGSEDSISVSGVITTDLIPSTDVTHDIGSASFRWNVGYFGDVRTSTLTSPTAGTIYDDDTGLLVVDGITTNAIYNDDSSIFYDSATSSLNANIATFSDIYNDLDEIVYSSITNTLTAAEFIGDVRGSVFADDSSIFFDAINSVVTADAGSINTLNADRLDSTTGLITMGTVDSTRLEIFYDGADDFFRGNSLVSQRSVIASNVSRGTTDSPQAVQLGDPISGMLFRGHNGSNYVRTSAITSFVDSDGVVSGSGISGSLVLLNTNIAGTGIVFSEFDAHGSFNVPILRTGSYATTTDRDNLTGIEAGAIVHVEDNGSGSAEFQGYDGSGWVTLNGGSGGGGLSDFNVDIVTEGSNSRTLSLADNYKYIRVINADSPEIFVPQESSVNFPIGSNITIIQANDSQVEIRNNLGVIINSADGNRFTRTDYSSVTLTKVGANEWDLIGDLVSTRAGGGF